MTCALLERQQEGVPRGEDCKAAGGHHRLQLRGLRRVAELFGRRAFIRRCSRQCFNRPSQLQQCKRLVLVPY